MSPWDAPSVGVLPQEVDHTAPPADTPRSAKPPPAACQSSLSCQEIQTANDQRQDVTTTTYADHTAAPGDAQDQALGQAITINHPNVTYTPKPQTAAAPDQTQHYLGLIALGISHADEQNEGTEGIMDESGVIAKKRV